jgi:hypothetical protein
VGKIYVAAVIVMTVIMPAPTTKIAGEFDVCVLKEKRKCLPALMTCVKT